MQTCSREDCNNPLNKGRMFCSTSCAATSREEKKRQQREPGEAIPLLPSNTMERMVEAVGEDAVNFVLEEINAAADSIPISSIPQTLGDWTLSFDGKKEYRTPGCRGWGII